MKKKRFEKSELYRKYIIELTLQKDKVYTIWGTDLLDQEIDKLIFNDGKLLIFKSLDRLAHNLKDVPPTFHDEENFNRWVREENLRKTYLTYDFRFLAHFDAKLLEDKETSIMLLNCINLIQDLSIQINHQRINLILGYPHLEILKDYIYNIYFWKKEVDTNLNFNLGNTYLYDLLKTLYNEFLGILFNYPHKLH